MCSPLLFLVWVLLCYLATSVVALVHFLLSVRVTGPLRKQVLVRRALLYRILAELSGKDSTTASRRPEAVFDAFPDRFRPKLGPNVLSLLQNLLS